MNKSTEFQIKFPFYPSENKSVSVTANYPHCTLADAIKGAGEKLKNFPFENRIIFAEVNGPFGEVAVLPDILCQELKPHAKVRAKCRKGATPSLKTNESKKVDDESSSDKENKITRKQILFYIKSNNSGITKIANTAYEGKPLCVVAHAKDTLKDAILKDGRFCVEFELLEDNDRLSDVPLQYQVSNYSGQIFIMKKRAGKRKEADKAGVDESESINPRKKSLHSAMPTTVTASFTDEIRKAMVEGARNSALETLIEPCAEKDKQKLDKRIQSIARKFGKVASSAIPARILPKLTQAAKSVGLIKCGDCTGTCFLLTKNLIITAQHVINNINTKRSQSTNKEMYKTISIYFDFESPLELGTCFGEVDEKKIFASDGKLDYAICVLKWRAPTVRDLTPLGPSVKSALPHSGLVILIGHPDSRYKRVETCRILPGYNWHSTLCKRALEAEQYCQQHPDECHIFNNKNETCIHIYKGRYLQGDHPNQLPYDTSFFEGSSGSPVFNADGDIVAMHTQGYPILQGSKEVSLMEFGCTFGAIYRDVKTRYSPGLAKHLFPQCA